VRDNYSAGNQIWVALGLCGESGAGPCVERQSAPGTRPNDPHGRIGVPTGTLVLFNAPGLRRRES